MNRVPPLWVVLGTTLLLFYVTGLNVAAALTGVVLVVVVTGQRLLYGLGLLPFAIGLTPEFMIMGLPIRAEDVLIPVLLVMWVVHQTEERKQLKPTGLTVALTFFLFFMLTATIHAYIVNPEFDSPLAFFHFFKHVEYVVIFLLGLNIVDDRRDIRFILVCMVSAAGVAALRAILTDPTLSFLTVQGAVADATGANPALDRVTGPATETANIFGGYLMFHMLVATALLLETKNGWLRLVWLAAVLVMFYPMMFTLSRSSYAGLLAGLVFLGVFRDWRILFGLVLIPLMGTFLFPETVIERFLSIYEALQSLKLDPSWAARVRAWELYLPTIIKNPFIGEGMFFIPPGEVDNEYVLRGVETGVLGLISFLWVFTGFWLRARRLFLDAVYTVDRQVGLCFTAGLTGMAVHALAATSFTTIRTAEPLYLMAGIVTAGYLMLLGVTREHTRFHVRLQESKRRLRHRRARQADPKFG